MFSISKTLGRLAGGPRAEGADGADSPETRGRLMVLWSLVALVPASTAAGLVAWSRRPPTEAALGLAVAAEAPASIRAPKPTPQLQPEPQAEPAVAKPDQPEPKPEPAPRVEETQAPRPPVEEPRLVPVPADLVVRSMPPDVVPLGRALFDRRWRPGDPRSHGGDGLGPVYNATSCLECHGQGGPGGSGAVANNARLVSVLGLAETAPRLPVPLPNGPAPDFLVMPLRQIDPARAALLVGLHPGFAETRSIVLHRFGVAPGYDAWERRLASSLTAYQMISAGSGSFRGATIGDMALHMTERNPSPLFGSGRIDAIPDVTLRLVAADQSPEIRGRVPRTPEGKVGKFGWKGQTASLRDFVLAACANELGLEVPGHHQAVAPFAPGREAPGLDMTERECDALISYVRDLPAPVVRDGGESNRMSIERGRQVFSDIGCAGCHVPNVGRVEGVYSDLLLHDMGQSLSDPGMYYGNVESPGAAKPEEWRTPPLWGVRDSGPYLHDGRAQTLEEVISLHGGQAEASARMYASLEPQGQSLVKTFLNSLAAPAPDPLTGDAERDGPPAPSRSTPSRSAGHRAGHGHARTGGLR